MRLYSDQLRDAYNRLGFVWDPRGNIFGVQNGDGSVTDLYDDLIGIATDTEILLFAGSTDPGKYFTDNPLPGVDGCAHVVPNKQYPGVWLTGCEHLGHPAFWQVGNFEIWRDINRNGVWDAGDRVTVGADYCMFLHIGIGPTIDRYGAGCTLVEGVKNNADFHRYAEKIFGLQSRVTYALIKQEEIK